MMKEFKSKKKTIVTTKAELNTILKKQEAKAKASFQKAKAKRKKHH